MQVVLNKAKLYLLFSVIAVIITGAAIGVYIFKKNKTMEEARQQEIANINLAVKEYIDLTEVIENKLSFSIENFKSTENEFANLNLLGWRPVEFRCQSVECEFKLATDNKNYVGIPNIALDHENLQTVMSGDSLSFKGINLNKNIQVLDKNLYEALPLCTESLTDVRKLYDIAGFSLSSQGKSQHSSFTFQQPTELVHKKVLLDKAKKAYLDVQGIDWNVQSFDWIKMSYIFRYILDRKNVGISAIRHLYNEGRLGYSATGTIYCRID